MDRELELVTRETVTMNAALHWTTTVITCFERPPERLEVLLMNSVMSANTTGDSYATGTLFDGLGTSRLPRTANRLGIAHDR